MMLKVQRRNCSAIHTPVAALRASCWEEEEGKNYMGFKFSAFILFIGSISLILSAIRKFDATLCSLSFNDVFRYDVVVSRLSIYFLCWMHHKTLRKAIDDMASVQRAQKKANTTAKNFSCYDSIENHSFQHSTTRTTKKMCWNRIENWKLCIDGIRERILIWMEYFTCRLCILHFGMNFSTLRLAL